MGKNCFFIVMLLARCRKINKNRAMNETRILTSIEIYYSMLISRGSTAEELNEWLNGWDKNDSLFSSQISNHHLCRCSSLRIFISSFWFSSSPFIWKWLNRVSFFAFIPYEQGLLTWGYFMLEIWKIHLLTPRQQVLFFPVIDRKIFEIKFLLVEWHSKYFSSHLNIIYAIFIPNSQILCVYFILPHHIRLRSV